MNSKVLILSNRYSVDSRILYTAALNNGWKIWRFVSHEIPNWIQDTEIAIYCETAIADYLAEKLNIKLISPRDNILTELPYDFVKRNIYFTTYKDFKMPEHRMFIKPADYKHFPAGIYSTEDTIPGFTHCQPDDPILLSEVVKFINEYRLFVLNHTILTGAIYVRESEFVGDHNMDNILGPQLLNFANNIVKLIKNKMPKSYVLDIGLLDNGEYAVIEFNPSFASGIYGADENKVLLCIEAACERLK